jgi:glycosyltransferase involved in cell wall biosynthesis
MNRLLSLVIPCYNPKKNFISALRSETDFLNKQKFSFEVVVVDDGSDVPVLPEYTEQDELFKNIRLIRYPKNHGKGYALRKGVEAAKGDWIVYTDADFPYNHLSLLKILDSLQRGADVAVGIRPASYYESLPTSRKIISKMLRLCIRKTLDIPTDDTQCGLKGFNQKGKEIFLKTRIHRYLFDLEFIQLAAKAKLSIELCEVQLKPHLEMPAVSAKILFQEAFNFLQIIIRK